MLSEKEKPGLWGEIYAARFMRENGYEIITANYRCRLGEIDIIAVSYTHLTLPTNSLV